MRKNATAPSCSSQSNAKPTSSVLLKICVQKLYTSSGSWEKKLTKNTLKLRHLELTYKASSKSNSQSMAKGKALPNSSLR